MHQKQMFRFFGPITIFCALCILTVMILDASDGKVLFGKKDGVPQHATRSEDPGRFTKIVGGFIGFSVIGLLVGIGITFAGYRKAGT